MKQAYLKSSFSIGSLIQHFNKTQLKKDVVVPQVGDFIKIGFEISEGQKTRIQTYKGFVIAIRGTGITKSILLRRSSKGFCSERTVLMYSPQVKEFKILTHTNVRRSKLYYVRQLQGKRARMLVG